MISSIIFGIGFLLFIAVLCLFMVPRRSAYRPYTRIKTRNAGVRVIQPIIPAHKDMSIIGDGAWNATTPAQYPKRSALVRDMEEPRGV